jgi:diketogulonate reductase-like aldo/keto reductase
MLTKPIPSTGENIPIIGLGTYRAFDVPSKKLDKKLDQVLKLFFKAGGTVIDTSPMYGNSETIIGQLLAQQEFNPKCFLATKVWTNGKREGSEEMTRSISRMDRNKLELMQVHNLVDADNHLDTLKEWKKLGKIKYIGITHYTDKAFDELASYIKKYPEIDFCQFPYSIGRRTAEDYFLDLCNDLQVATLINRPFEQDELFEIVQYKSVPKWGLELGCTTWAQFFLKYILGHKAVTCVIPATSDPRHMADNLVAGSGRLPSNKELKKMTDYFDSL